ncbi:MAG: hypothetical protein HKP56_16620 [Anderseniella sp.]|nr:hypothetical protein [Anderseniella sp.]
MNEYLHVPDKRPELSRRAFLMACAAMICCVLPVDPAAAQGLPPWQRRRRERRRERRRRRWRRRERRQLRDAIESGEVRPLHELMRKFKRQVDGEVLDVRYRERGPNRVYIFIVLLPNGRVTRYVMDARNERIFTLDEAFDHYGFRQRD